MYQTIIHATDLRENHYVMCERAAQIAKKFSAKLFLMHVIEPPSTLQLAQGLGFAEFDMPVREDALSVMQVIAESLNIAFEQLIVEVGSIKQHILETIKTLDAQLIIIGKQSSDSYYHSLLGSTAHAVSQHAGCDVLILHE
ncbi:MAG: universal stress protein [Legionellaceae bacterium]|nr:universal stress protein [Legionellaceae bacterium]